MLKKTNIAALISCFMLIFSAAPAFAEHGSGDDISGSRVKNQQKIEDQKEDRLEAAKEKACGRKKTFVSGVESRVGKRGQGRLDAITKIATKVETYIKNKNLTVANYDQLISNINDKKATAQAAVNKVNSEIGSVGQVNCQGGDGKDQIETFKKDMRAQQAALKDYRNAVKALVKAAKDAKTSTGDEQ